MQALPYRLGLLIQQLDRNRQVGFGLAGLGLFGIHQFQECLAVFLKALERGVGIRGDAQKATYQSLASRRAARCLGVQVLDPQDFHTVDHGGGDASDLARVAQSDAGEKLAGGLSDAGQDIVAMRQQGCRVAEVHASGGLLSGGQFVRRQVGDVHEPRWGGFRLETRVGQCRRFRRAGADRNDGARSRLWFVEK